MGDKTPARSVNFRELWPDVWALLRPRRKILAVGLVLMVINRVSGLVLPMSTKFLIDDIIGKHHLEKLTTLILAVVLATLIQGSSSFALTQLLSKAAQRLIAELRQKVQRHVGRLPIAYYDANKTGVLVSRIMSDVEGVRNLVGTGLVEFAGGLITAVISLFVLLRISPQMTGIARRRGAGVRVRPESSIQDHPSDLSRARQDQRGSHGRLTESLGGVRVVKGYHGEEREAAVFSKGVGRLLDNVMKSLTAMSIMTLSATVLMGIVGATVMYIGTRQIAAGTLTLGGLDDFHRVPGVSDRAGDRRGADRNADFGSFRRPGADAGSAARAAGRSRIRSARSRCRRSAATSSSRTWFFPMRPASRCCMASRSHRVPVQSPRWSAPPGSGKSTIIGLISAFYKPDSGRVHGGRLRPLQGEPGFLPHTTRCGAAGNIPVRRDHSRERRLLAAGRDRRGSSARLPHRAS